MEYDPRNYQTMHTPQINENDTSFTTRNNECYDDDQLLTELPPAFKSEKSSEPQPDVTIHHKVKLTPRAKGFATSETDSPHTQIAMGPPSPMHSHASGHLSPIVVMGNDQNFSSNGEISSKSIPKQTATTSSILRQQNDVIDIIDKDTPNDIVSNATKRKSMPAPFPVLTPINDPIELYCLSLVDSLRNMPRGERERVKFEFAKILKDAKYNDES